MSDPQLEVCDVVKAFGGNRAIDGCSLSVRQGSITGVIGPNGAGKSTLFNVISGLIRADRGEVWLEGARIDSLAVHEIARLGIARTFQTPREITDLTATENLMLVPKSQWGERLRSLLVGRSRVRAEEQEIGEEARRVLELVEMSHQENALAGILSIGQKKLLELARCLVSRPALALLDEPTAGVNPRLIGDLVVVMERMAQGGVTLLVIEHNMNVIMRLCQHLIVLHRGRVLCEGPPEAIQADPAVQDAYLGAAV